MTEVAARPQAESSIHRKLCLKVKGEGLVRKGDWQQLIRTALHYPDRDWEIVESVNVGVLTLEKIVTRHVALSGSGSSQNHGVIENV
jgi:hypothetical protein